MLLEHFSNLVFRTSFEDVLPDWMPLSVTMSLSRFFKISAPVSTFSPHNGWVLNKKVSFHYVIMRCEAESKYFISMAQWKTAISPLLKHWINCSLTLSHLYVMQEVHQGSLRWTDADVHRYWIKLLCNCTETNFTYIMKLRRFRRNSLRSLIKASFNIIVQV